MFSSFVVLSYELGLSFLFVSSFVFWVFFNKRVSSHLLFTKDI